MIFRRETEFILSEIRTEFRNASNIKLELQNINPRYGTLFWL
jgi:hypothetical protein